MPHSARSIALGVLFLIIAIGVWLGATGGAFIKSALEDLLSQRTGRPVVIRALGIAFTPGPVLEIHELTVGGADDDAEPVAVVSRMDLKPDIRALWSQRPALARVVIDDADIRQPGGLFIDSVDDTKTAGSPFDFARRWPVGELIVRRAQLHLPGAHPDEVSIRDARLQRLAYGRLRLAQTTLQADEQRIDIQGELTADTAEPSGRLGVTIEQLTLDPLPAVSDSTSHAPLTLSGALDLHVGVADTPEFDTAAVATGARISVKGELDLDGASDDTDIRFDVTTIDESHVVRVHAAGRLRGEAVDLQATLAPLMTLADKTQPYPVDIALRLGETRLAAKGDMIDPLDRADFNLAVKARGANPQDLYRLVGVSLPSLPPYDLSGHLARSEDRWHVSELDGKIGDSDIRGTLSVDLRGEVPVWQAELQSQLLDPDDLAGLIGGEPDASPNETASPRQRQAAIDEQHDADVLADDPLPRDQLRAVRADVSYTALHVRRDTLPLDDMSMQIRLDGGKLFADPIRFGIAGGQIALQLRLDTTRNPPRGVVEARVHNIHLEQALQRIEIARKSGGILGGQGKIWIEGRSFAELLANADGGLTLLMADGKVDPLLVEAAGLDPAETLLVWLGKREPIAVDCTYADLQIERGTAHLAKVLVDTPDTLFMATGDVDLGSETLDVRIEPHPKDFSLLSAPSPLLIGGTFADPELTVLTAQALTRITIAGVLSAVASPVAGLLPLLQVGEDQQPAYCNGIVSAMGEAQTKPGDQQ